MKDMNQKQYLPEIPADNDLETILSEAVWAAHSLFRRGKTSGSSANLSVIHNGVIYISASGTLLWNPDHKRFLPPLRPTEPFCPEKAQQGAASAPDALPIGCRRPGGHPTPTALTACSGAARVMPRPTH